MATLAGKSAHDTLVHNSSKAAATKDGLNRLQPTEYRSTRRLLASLWV